MINAQHLTKADEPGNQRWDLSAAERRHRVEIRGSRTRTITWYVDDQLLATTKSSRDDVHLEPGQGLDTRGSAPDGSPLDPPSADPASPGVIALGQSDLGAIRVKFTDLGRVKRVTWYQDPGSASAITGVGGTGGIDLDPEPGSPAALHAERIRRHPRRYAAIALAGGAVKVGVPLLIGFFMVRLTVSIPWPDWNLPAIPWPDWDLPAIPWPDIDLPDLEAPAWMTWLVDHLRYVWPIVLAGILARSEIRRQRQQDALKAELKTETVPDEPSQDRSAALPLLR